MFLINPKNHNYNIYKFLIENYDMYDGGIIGNLFFPCLSNPAYYIEERYLFNIYGLNQEINLNEYYGLHFGLSQKPFLQKINSNKEHFRLYNTLYDYFRNKYNI